MTLLVYPCSNMTAKMIVCGNMAPDAMRRHDCTTAILWQAKWRYSAAPESDPFHSEYLVAPGDDYVHNSGIMTVPLIT